MKRFSDIEPRVVRWLWYDRIPRGMISIVAGLPSGGKSLFTIYLAAQISRMAGGGEVIISAHEDPAHEVLRPRLEAARADLARVHLANLRLPSGLGQLESDVAKFGVDLIVIDPVADHLDAGVSRFSDSIRQVTQPLAEMAERTDVAVVMVEHALKSIRKNAHPLQAIGGGSSGLRAAARMAFVGGRDPGDEERVLLCAVKNNLRDDPRAIAFTLDSASYTDGYGRESTTGLLVFREECDFSAMDLLVKPSTGKVGRPPQKRAAAAEWLIDYLWRSIDHEAVVSDIVEDARTVGITLKTLDRAAKLDVNVLRFQRGGRGKWWWKLPQETIDALWEQEQDGDDG